MYFVYLLKDELGKIYIGQTADVYKRLEEHKSGKVYWTSRMRNIELVYFEAYLTRELAVEREHKLKKRASSYQGLIKRIKITT